jgi:hypothetical protein
LIRLDNIRKTSKGAEMKTTPSALGSTGKACLAVAGLGLLVVLIGSLYQPMGRMHGVAGLGLPTAQGCIAESGANGAGTGLCGLTLGDKR